MKPGAIRMEAITMKQIGDTPMWSGFIHNHKPLDQRSLHESMVQSALREFRLRGKISFIWLLQSTLGGDKLAVLETKWTNDAEKQKCFQAIKILMAVTGVNAYSQAVEAWMATRTAGDGLEKVQPRDRSDREDVILISTFARGTPGPLVTKFGVDYHQPPKAPTYGKRVDLDRDGGGGFAGRMWDLFDD